MKRYRLGPKGVNRIKDFDITIMHPAILNPIKKLTHASMNYQAAISFDTTIIHPATIKSSY